MFSKRMNKIGMMVLWITVLCIAATAGAQSTSQGAIGGTVFDSTGAVVGGAAVVTLNVGTNAQATAKTDASGNYSVRLVEPGTYTVTVSAPGFEGFRADKVTVQVGQMTTVDAHLTVGSATQTVEVT